MLPALSGCRIFTCSIASVIELVQVHNPKLYCRGRAGLQTSSLGDRACRGGEVPKIVKDFCHN